MSKQELIQFLTEKGYLKNKDGDFTYNYKGITYEYIFFKDYLAKYKITYNERYCVSRQYYYKLSIKNGNLCGMRKQFIWE